MHRGSIDAATATTLKKGLFILYQFGDSRWASNDKRMQASAKWLAGERWRQCQRTRGLLLGGERDAGNCGIEDGLHEGEILLKRSESENADGRAAESIQPMHADGGGILNLESDLKRSGLLGTRDGWSVNSSQLRLRQVFPKHFALFFNVPREGDARAERLFHGPDAAGECIFDDLLNAKTFLDVPSLGNLVKRPATDDQCGRHAGIPRRSERRGRLARRRY